MSLLDSLYQQAILEHYKRPHNHGVIEPHDLMEEGVNPSCGDEVTLYLRLAGGVIEGVSFEGEGCAISQATASLMTDAVKGRSVAEALRLAGSFKAMVRGEAPSPELGELATLAGVAKLPARVKCAVLPFATLERALEEPAG